MALITLERLLLVLMDTLGVVEVLEQGILPVAVLALALVLGLAVLVNPV